MIFLAFAFKVTKVSPMPDRNTCKLPFCSNLKSTATRCHYGGWVHLPMVSSCVLVSIYLSICHCTGIFLYFLINWLFWMSSHLWHWTAKSSLCSLAVSWGGPSAFGIYMCNSSSSWCSGMAGISVCLSGGVHLPMVSSCVLVSMYLSICHCTGIFLYFLISWLFWMGSHWWHWTAKSSLCTLAVSWGGFICLWYLYVQ